MAVVIIINIRYLERSIVRRAGGACAQIGVKNKRIVPV